jgi:hypothetical protein
MNHKIVGAILTLLSCVTTQAQAEFISLDDWWLQTGPVGGLRQNIDSPSMYFAVSKNTTWSKSATYEAMSGYHVASLAEAKALFVTHSQITPVYVYYGQDGWSNFVYEGQTRKYFRYADSGTNATYRYAGHYANYNNWSGNPTTLNFAGLVMIKDSVVSEPAPTPVPEPAALFALSLLGLVVKRRHGQARLV